MSREYRNENTAKFWEKIFGKNNLVSKHYRRSNKTIEKRKKRQFKRLKEIDHE